MDTLGKRLRSLRKERRLTQVEVAEAAGVDRGHMASVELDKARLSLESARALASFYAVSLEWLIEGRGPARMDARSSAILEAVDALPEVERETYLRLIFARARELSAA